MTVVLTSTAADAQVKLIDFGAAVSLEENEQVIAGGKVGTWTYWAPEQARISANISPQFAEDDRTSPAAPITMIIITIIIIIIIMSNSGGRGGAV